MKIFLYEFFTGGGCWACGEPPTPSLMAEAQAMVRAVAADFAALDGIEILTTRDARLAALHPAGCSVTTVASSDDEWAAIEQLARNADWTLLIAPETRDALLARCRLVETTGGRLLSPPSACVEICASKQATAERLRSCGVRVPRGERIGEGDRESFPWNDDRNGIGSHGKDSRPRLPNMAFPVVVKPDDGCGSQGVRLVTRGAREFFPWNDDRNGIRSHGKDSRSLFRVEEFVHGLPASVSVICGPAECHPLPACQQILSADGRLAYCGGGLPLRAQLDCRARKLALAAVAALPKPRGYLGVDLVLGQAENGSLDYVIEINPRLTTSYVGLRALARTNLAAAMLAVLGGQSPDLCFEARQVEFTADGAIVSKADVEAAGDEHGRQDACPTL